MYQIICSSLSNKTNFLTGDGFEDFNPSIFFFRSKYIKLKQILYVEIFCFFKKSTLIMINLNVVTFQLVQASYFKHWS